MAVELLHCKLIFWTQTPNQVFSSHFYSLLTLKLKSSQLEAFPVSGLDSLTLSQHALFLNFRKKIGNCTVLFCFAAANKYLKTPDNILDFTQILMHSQTNSVPASQSYRKWHNTSKKILENCRLRYPLPNG